MSSIPGYARSRDPTKAKVCSGCKINKQPGEYFMQAGKLRSRCKECSKPQTAEQIEAVRARSKKWDAENAERRREISKEYAARNPEKRRAAMREYGQKKPHVARAIAAKKRAIKRLAYAAWDRELTDLVVTEASILAISRRAATGVAWHIDHIVPLSGVEVCGVHVWSNLQLLPASVNIAKKNRFTGTEATRGWI